jgi:adenylate cyclase class IV
MSFRNREIEVKLIAYDTTLEAINSLLHDMLGPSVRKKVWGRSTDVYWPVKDPEVVGDFVRTRKFSEDINHLTVKGKDRDSNINRLEVDIETTTPHSKLVRFCRAIGGKETGSIDKEYYVYWPTTDEHENISCYVVTNQEYPHIFIEVECTDVGRMEEFEYEVLRSCGIRGIRAERAPGSLYEMFILDGGMVRGK